MADRLLSWFDITGTEWPLNGEIGYQALRGAQGLYGIPVTPVLQDAPMRPGTTVKYIQLNPSHPVIPLAILTNDEQTLDGARRALKWAMTPSRGPGKLRHQSNDGMIRDLACYLVKGFEGDESGGLHRPGSLWLNLEFLAPDPFWYDPDFTQLNFAVATGSGLFDPPAILPLKIAPSGVIGTITITNSGDAVAWPKWVISGPMTSATFTNNTSGDVLTLTATLVAGQTITVDTDIYQKTVKREDGSKHFEYVDAASSLWAIQEGLNNISVVISGSGTGSGLTLQYKQRYEGV